MLLIDERNYQLIFDNLAAVLAGELHSSGKYVYTGMDKVEVKVIEFDFNDGKWLVEYHHLKSGKKAYFTGRPFRKGELWSLLGEAGFSKIEQFSDYQSGDNPQAEYYQYVCIK